MSDILRNEILMQTQLLIFKFGYKKVTMKDIAETCKVSRPTLYKEFSNKESILTALVADGTMKSHQDYLQAVEEEVSLKAKLTKFFDIWVIRPASLAISSETGKDLLLNVSNYVPEAVEKHYKEFESCLLKVLRDSKLNHSEISVNDLARILTLASKGLKSTSSNLKELKKMTSGLVTITCSSITTENC